MKCKTCGVEYDYGQPAQIENTDGTITSSIEDVVVLVVNEAGTDYDPLFFHNNLCASEWADRNNVRLARPSSFPARYYEAINEEPDPSQRPVVQDPKHTDQVAKLPRSRMV